MQTKDFIKIPNFSRYLINLDGEVKVYPSAVDCARAYGLKPTALNYRLSSNGNTTFSDGNRYGYYPYD